MLRISRIDRTMIWQFFFWLIHCVRVCMFIYLVAIANRSKLSSVKCILLAYIVFHIHDYNNLLYLFIYLWTYTLIHLAVARSNTRKKMKSNWKLCEIYTHVQKDERRCNEFKAKSIVNYGQNFNNAEIFQKKTEVQEKHTARNGTKTWHQRKQTDDHWTTWFSFFLALWCC